jgi:hypothetical protein
MAGFSWVGTSKFRDTTNNQATPSTSDGVNTWCGRWESKNEAIKSLFNWYKRKSYKTIRWYISIDGEFRWFEVGPRLGKEVIFGDDLRVVSFTVREDATNIVNDMTGTYGDSETGGTVHLTNNSSIAIYGRCIDDTISDSNMDETEMTAYVQWQLDNKSVPIYEATLTLTGFQDMEPGRQVRFPDDPYYSDKLFTVVDWTFTADTTGAELTTVNLTTDENVISLPNEFDVIRATAQSEADKVRSKVGTVSAVSGDRVIVDLESSPGTMNARYVSKI